MVNVTYDCATKNGVAAVGLSFVQLAVDCREFKIDKTNRFSLQIEEMDNRCDVFSWTSPMF